MGRPAKQVDFRLLCKVSSLYYEQHLNQQEIADKLVLSRPKVSRLLRRALAEGVVQISVQPAPGVDARLEQALEAQFGLQEVMIVSSEGGAASARELGCAAAAYFHRTLVNGERIGFSGGALLREMVVALQPVEAPDCRVVPLRAASPSSIETDAAASVCCAAARVLGCHLALLPSGSEACENGRVDVAYFESGALGVPPESLMHIRRRVGIAASAGNVQALCAALQGGVFNVLITDYALARKLIGSG